MLEVRVAFVWLFVSRVPATLAVRSCIVWQEEEQKL